MIGRLCGILLEKEIPYLLIEVSGVAYEVQASMTTFSQLPEIGQKVILHMHLSIREDAHLLYGFFEKQERELFRSLIKVNGIGPKSALAILSSIDPTVFINCVLNNDADSLVRLPGIGKKTAERLIIEMRDKLTHWQGSQNVVGFGNDAIQALVALGYKPQEAAQAISKVGNENTKTQELIKLALNYLSVS